MCWWKVQPGHENVFPFFNLTVSRPLVTNLSWTAMLRLSRQVCESHATPAPPHTIPQGGGKWLSFDSGEFGKSWRPRWISIRWRWFLHNPHIPQDVRISLLEVKKRRKSSVCVMFAKGNCVPLLAMSARGLLCDYQEFRACPAFEEINSSWR